MKQLSKNKIFGGWHERYSHSSKTTNTEMTFAIYLPPQAADRRVPVLYFLSGLTCTDENFSTKAGAQQYAAKYGLALVIPDTSPRGKNVPDDKTYDLGQGAGFYLNATQNPWSQYYHMYDYIVEELPELIEANFPVTNQRSIFGHSMGGLLGYELYYRLIEKYKRPPKKIFISACKPPHLINKKIRIPNEKLSNIDYMAEVVKLGGTPAEILDYPDLVDLLTPVLKQDFQNIRRYNFQKKKRKIDCPVTVFFGTQDEVNREDMEGWKMFIENTFEIIPFTGNHFFISDHVQEIAEIINKSVAS